jgi:hypothetical protein
MKNTRFMELMFSTTDEELKAQVDSDIKDAQKNGVVETEEVKYEKTGDGDVAITDKENGEVTIAQKNPDEADTYDLIAVPDDQLEKFVHPSNDGVTPGNQVGAPDETVKAHEGLEGGVVNAKPDITVAEETGKEGPAPVCPECGKEECECDKDDEEKEFSITSDNAALQKIFSMNQELVEYLFSEVIESAETSNVGDLKIEKCADDDNSVVVTSKATGDQVKVTLDDEEMEVTELDSKNFSEDEEANGNYMPLLVVGVQPYDHIIVDTAAYGEEAANALKAQLEEDGVEAVQIFETQEEAREYAFQLLHNLGANPAAGDVDEPELQKEYSDFVGTDVYTHSYRTENTVLMSRMFSEDACGISETRDAVEEVINKGKEVSEGDCTVLPVDEMNAIIQDGDEFTLATLSGEDMLLQSISLEEAQAVLGDESIIEYESEEDEEEKEFSYCNEEETRFFSEGEEMTNYMIRLFSEEADQNEIEAAVATGEPTETEAEIITPIDGETAVVEDKENGEFTKVTIIDEDTMNAHPISDEEAENLLGEDEKQYSEYLCNEEETRFFSEGEEMTLYMVRLYSEDSDQDLLEEAIENGKQIENDTEIITPVSHNTAVVEDKESGEFTKAEIKNDNEIEVKPIEEDEADELTKDLKVEDNEEDEDKKDEKEEEQKEYSTLDRFFAETVAAAQPVVPAQPVAQAPVAPAEAPVEQPAPAPSVEEVEDKAMAAVASIKAAAEEASAQIMEAKAAPAPAAEPEIQEAQFSEKTFSQTNQNDTLVSWLQFK